MDSNNLIKQLQNSKLFAECPCGESFQLSDAILFDGLGKTPKEAQDVQKAMLDALLERETGLKTRKVSADKGAEQKALETGIGKIVEKIIPTYANFKIPASDCRTLFEPIDLIAFNGLSSGRVDSIDFIEIKSGNAKLNPHQRMVRDAVNDKQVGYKEL